MPFALNRSHASCRDAARMLRPRAVALLATLLLAGAAAAQPRPADDVARQLRYVPAAVADVQSQASRVTAEAVSQLRQAVPHQAAAIPASWRLVNVVGRQRGAGQEFVLFFQDERTRAVHTLVMDDSGEVQGRGSVTLPAR